MAVIKTITPYISRKKIDRIEAPCREIDSEEILERYIALISTRLSRDNTVEVKSLKQDRSVEQNLLNDNG